MNPIKINLLYAFAMIALLSLQSSLPIDSLEKATRKQSDIDQAQTMRDYAWKQRHIHPGLALQILEHAQKILEVHPGKDKKHYGQLAQILNNKAVINRNLGNYPAALDLNQRALAIAEEGEDSIQMGYAANDIANLFDLQGQHSKALTFATTSINIFHAIQDDQGYAYAIHSRAKIFDNIHKYDQALEDYLKALEIRIKLGNPKQIASSYNNIGKILFDLDSFSQAMTYHQKAIALADSVGNKYGVASSMIHMSKILLQNHLDTTALSLLDSALVIAKSLNAKLLIQNIFDQMALAYAELGQFKKAYQYNQDAELIQDQLFNEQVEMKIRSLHETFEAEMEERHAKIKKEKKYRRDNLQYSASAVGIMIIFFSLFLLNKAKLSLKVLEASVFFAFLILFEFTLVLFDPIVAKFSEEQPFIILIFNSALALIIFPMHSYLEKWLKKRLLVQREKKAQLKH